MPQFQCPTEQTVTYADYQNHWSTESRLFGYLEPTSRGRNLYLKTDGTYTLNQPYDDEIATVYYGGHIIEITDTEAASLTAAGYGAYITW